MTMGRRGGRGDRGVWGGDDCGGEAVDDDDDDDEGDEGGGDAMEREEGETRSIMFAILSSSSGQMSGQWEKPK